MMDEMTSRNISVSSLTLPSGSEPARNQQLVADWLHRLQREGFAQSISSASLIETYGDETDLAIEVQEFVPEEEIIVFDVADSSKNNACNSSAANSNPVEPAIQQQSSRRLPDPDLENMSYELQQGYRILRELMTDSNKSFVGPFLNAVDASAVGCADYYERIKRPMWMKRMHEKFLNGTYQTITEFVADMRLMLENCYRFNGPDHSISRKAQRLETLLEQKLALLSRELREKTSRIATSGRGLTDLQSGTRRLRPSGPHDSTALLNELRRQQAQRDREKRRQQMMEKRQHYEAFLQSLQSWEESLLDEPVRSHMRAMWELPQTCLFLILCASPLGLSEVSIYEFEMSFLMPRESSMFQRVMTSLLSTPHQRMRLDSKPLMPYRVWNERLTSLLRQWYKVLGDCNRDVSQACIKLGLEDKFFRVLGMTNPLDYRPFHELTLYQKVWIVKSLCDHCVETQKCLCDAIELQPPVDQRALLLGLDSSGYSYVHFPQFCGADLRIYRQKFRENSQDELQNSKRSKRKRLKRKSKVRAGVSSKCSSVPTSSVPSPSAPQRTRDSRLRQNPRQVLSYQAETPADSDSDANSDVSVDSDSESENEDVTASKNQTVDSPSKFNSSKSVCSPAPHDIAAVEGATVLRRSLRKVIEESKKDAVCSDSRRYSPQQFAGGSKRTRRKRLSAPSNCEQGVDISKDLKVASDENSPVQLDSAFCKKRLLTKKARAQSLKTKRSKVESSFQSATDQTVGNGVDAMDSSEKSSVSSVGIPKKPACIASSRSFESKLELTHLFGESETNSIDSDVVGMETSDSLIQSRLRTSGTSSPGNDHQKNDEKIGDFAAFRDTVKQENTDCDISTADNGSSITEQSFCQKSAIKQDLLSRDASVAKQHCERDDTLNDEMAEHKASNTDTKPDAASSLNFDASEDTKTAISENMLSEEKRPANFPVLSELESCNETSELKLFGDVTHRLKKAVDAEISLTDLAEDERELKQLNISEEEVTLENEKMSDKIMEDRNLSESKKGNVRTPEDEKVECCLGLTKENMENGDDVEKVENRPEPIKEDPPEILAPDLSEFELVADNIESLRQLVAKFASMQQTEKSSGGKVTKNDVAAASESNVCTEVELVNRLSSLLTELEPFEPKLLQFNKKTKIKLRKEQENYEEEPADEEKPEDIWLTSESEDSVTDENTSSVAAEYNESSQSSMIAPSVDESGPSLRSSLRRRTQIASAVVNRLRKRKADQSEDSPSTKQLKLGAGDVDKRTASSAEFTVRTTTCNVRSSTATSTTNTTRAPHRALLRIDQPNGNVCFIALDNVSDLSQLPVTSLIQHLMANQKLTFSQAPGNQRVTFTQAPSSLRMPLPHQRPSVSSVNSQTSLASQASSSVSLAGQKPLVSSVRSSYTNIPSVGSVPVRPVLPSSCSQSAASFAGIVSPTGQRLASISTTSVSVGQIVPASGRAPLATSQILALPILSNQVSEVAAGLRPPKPEMPAVNNGLAALFSAAFSAPTSHTTTDARPLVSCAPTTIAPDVNKTMVLLNPGVNPVHTLVGPAVRCINIPANQSSPDVGGIRANAMPVFMGLLANQQSTTAVQHRLLAVPLVNGSPASAAARLTAGSLSSPRTVLTLAPVTTSPLSASSMKLQQQPRYSGNMTVKALLGGRTTSSVDPVCNTAVKALLEGGIIPSVDAMLTKANSSVTTVPTAGVAFGLTESSSHSAVSVTTHPLSATALSTVDQSASPTNRTSLGSSGTSYILEAAASGLLNQSVMVHSTSQSATACQPSNIRFQSVRAAVPLNTLQSEFQVPVVNNASNLSVLHSAASVTTNNVQVQRMPLTIAASCSTVQRVAAMPTASVASVLRPSVITTARSLPVQQLAQAVGDSAVPRLDLASVAGGTQLQTLKLLPGATGPRLALQIVSVAGGSQQSGVVQLLPGSVMSQLVSAGLDINAIRAFVPQSRLRGHPPRAARNNTRTTTVMKAPIPALPRLNDLNHSPPSGSVSTNISNVRLPLLQSSVLSQCSTAVAHSTTQTNVTVPQPLATASFYRAATTSVTAALAATPGRPQTAVTPGTLPMPFSPIDASGTRPSQIIPRKFQVVALPGTTQPVSTPGGLQAVVVPSGKLPTVVAAGALQPLALQGTLQAAVPAVPLKTFSVAGKLPAEANAGTLRAAAVSGKLQTVAASPGTLQASQNVIMLQSSNGLVQLVQLPANCVRNANVLNFAGQGSAVVPRQTCIVTSQSATVSHLLTQHKETAVNITNSGVMSQSGTQCSTQASCLVDAANLFLMAANVVDQTGSQQTDPAPGASASDDLSKLDVAEEPS